MAQNISLDQSLQSTFTKAVKNIKTLIKKNEVTIQDQCTGNAAKATEKKAVLGKKRKVNRRNNKLTSKNHGKGVVYLSHIPEGFYEEEMFSYFSQFGRVTRLNLVKSKKNGRPKGYAFIEFLYSEVAQVVAETMNNYLMYGRLLKAQYIPGERTHRGMFRNLRIRPDNCPRSRSQKKWIQKINKTLTSEEEAGALLRETKRLNKVKEQLEKSGIHLNCQIEGGSLALLDDDMCKAGENPVLEIDESDNEVEFKLQPNVVRVVKRRSSQAPVTSHGVIEVETEAGEEISKRRVGRCRSLSTSVLSPFVRKVNAKGRKDGSKRKARPGSGPLTKHKSMSASIFSSTIKKIKGRKNVSKEDLKSNVSSVVKRKSLSMSVLSSSAKKVKTGQKKHVSKKNTESDVSVEMGHRSSTTGARSSVKKMKAVAESNISKRKIQPSGTKIVKRRSSSTSVISPRVKKVKAVVGNDVTKVTKVLKRKSSTSTLSPSVKKVKAEEGMNDSKRELQSRVSDIMESKSLSTSLLSPNLKKVKGGTEKDLSKRKIQRSATEVVKRRSLSTSTLSASVKKVKVGTGKDLLKRKSGPNATEVVRRRSLPASLLSPSVEKMKVGTDKDLFKRKIQRNATGVVRRRSLPASVLSPSEKKVKISTEKDLLKRKIQGNATKVARRRSLSTSILSPSVQKVKADAENNFSKRKVQSSATKKGKCRSSTSPFSPRIKKEAREEFLKKNPVSKC